MNDEMRKYWDRKLLETITKEPLIKLEPRKLTWREKLHNKYLNLIDSIYHKLTGNWPYEE